MSWLFPLITSDQRYFTRDTSAFQLICARCGTIIHDVPVYYYGLSYHQHCYPAGIAQYTVTTITEERIREIVREELDRKRLQKAQSKIHRNKTNRNSTSAKK